MPDSETGLSQAWGHLLPPLFGTGTKICFLTDGRPSLVARDGAAPKRVLVASMPKAGTYLLAAYLDRLGLASTDIHVDWWSFTDYRDATIEQARKDFRDLEVKIDLPLVLELVWPGQFVVGHLANDPDTASLFADYAVLAITREARAAVVSYIRWVELADRAEADDHVWLNQRPGPLRTEAFLDAKGEWLMSYLDRSSRWSGPNVLQLSFETLYGDRGREKQTALALAIARHVGLEISLKQALAALDLALGKKTMTFSGARSQVEDHWSDACESRFVALGGEALNSRILASADSPAP